MGTCIEVNDESDPSVGRRGNEVKLETSYQLAEAKCAGDTATILLNLEQTLATFATHLSHCNKSSHREECVVSILGVDGMLAFIDANLQA